MIQVIKKIFSPTVMQSAMQQFGEISLQNFLIYTLIGISILFIIIIICRIYGKIILISDVLTGVVLSIYGSIIIQLTLMCRENGSRIGIELNLFHGLLGAHNNFHWLMWAYVLLNCLLFVPYGFTISLFSMINDRKPWIQLLSITLLSFITSMTIECTQLILQRGYYEIQDLVVNTLGGIFGWVLFRILFEIVKIVMRRRGDTEC